MDFGTLFSAAGAVIGLITGGKPGLVIGGIELSGLNSPERMPFGGEQKAVETDLPGGVRTVDLMGAFERPLDISGTLSGPDALSTARRLDALRKGEKAVKLTWASFTYSVIVKNTEFEYAKQGYEIPYRLSCIVIPTPPVAIEKTGLDKIADDVAQALGLSDASAALAEAQKALTIANAALPLVTTLSPTAAATLGTYLSAGSTVVDGAKIAAEGNLAGLSLAASAGTGLIGAGTATSSAAKLLSATSSAQTLAAAVTASGYLTRATAALSSTAAGK